MPDQSDKTSDKDVDIEDSTTSSLKGSVRAREGGLRAWLTVLGSCLVYFASFGIINSFGFFQTLYTKEYLSETPSSTISFIGTIQMLLMNLLAAPAGSLFDCFGLKWLYIVSGLGTSGGLVLLSICQLTVLWQVFLIQGVMVGIAIAFGTQPALVVVGHHFYRRRSLTMGIVAASGSVGGVCFPLILGGLKNMIGFGWTLRVVALIVGACYIIAICISRTNGMTEPLRGISTLLDFRGFLDQRYSVLALGAFGTMLGQSVPYFYIAEYCDLASPGSPVMGTLLSILNAASIVGRILGGLVADEIGPGNVTYPMTILSGVLCLTMWLVTSSANVLVAFAILYGFCSGIFIAVLPVIVAQVSPEDKLGGRIGAFYSFLAIAQLVGSPIAGALKRPVTEAAHGYMGPIVFAGTSISAGGLIIFVARWLHDKDLRKRL